MPVAAWLSLDVRYFSPYPLTETEAEDVATTPHSHGPSSTARIPGVSRSSIRSHGRTSDLLAGGLGRSHAGPEKAMLWVCDRCFKYMAEGPSYESHIVRCSSPLICAALTEARSSRESARESPHRDAKCTSVVLISSGRSTVLTRRFVWPR